MAARFGEAGPLMPLVLLAGFLSIAVIVERAYAIVYRARSDGRAFMERVLQLVRGGKVDEAIKLCTARRSTLSDIGLVVLRGRTRDDMQLSSIAAAATLALAPPLRHRLRYIAALAAVAVLAGLLAVTVGMEAGLVAAVQTSSPDQFRAFARTMAEPVRALSAAIVVALVDLVAYAYLANQATIIDDQMREFAARLTNALTDRPDVRLGHR